MSLRVTEHKFTGATTSIASYDSTKTNLGTLMIQKSGSNPEDNFVGPFPVSIARPMEESTSVAMMYPHVITYSSTIDWVFLVENTTAIAKRIFLYEYNKNLATYNWKGYITANFGANASNTCRGFRALRYLHTTGTVSVAAPATVLNTGTVTVTAAGLMTHSGTSFSASHIGLMVGLGSTDPTQINCWYPIVAYLTTSTMTLSGVSSAYAAGTPFVIASCVVTGSSTQFSSELIAAGTGATNVVGGLGPRIGFGSTDPTQITQWFQIGSISSNTSMNLVTSPGVIAANTPYVIEELRFIITITHGTPANGGLFIAKGVSYLDFQTSSVAGPLVLPYIATAIDNQRGVYWLADASTVTNTSACGCTIDDEVSKTDHSAYVIDGINDVIKIYKYNLRANNTVAAGKMTLSGSNIVITSTQTISGFLSHLNNGRIGTINHGPGSGVKSLYFVTSTRLYRAILANITGSSSNFIPTGPDQSRLEVPPGGIASFAPTYDLASIEIADSIDRLIVLTTNLTAYRNYVTAYPTNDGDQFTHIWGIDDKQQDTSYVPPTMSPHFNSKSQQLSVWSQNGVAHVISHGATIALNQMYAIPFGAHMTYAGSTSQRVITPSIDTAGCVKFNKLLVNYERGIGIGEIILPTEIFKVYYRTENITVNATSSWSLLGLDGDLSGVTPSSAIQFMFEFSTIGPLCLPSRIFNIAVTFEDDSTDSHYQLSTSLSDIVNKRFAWRHSKSFGGTVPNLKIELFNAETGSSLLTDTTASSANGTWEKSINDGSSWISFNTDDKANETTYIRYTPSSLVDNIRVKALLTRN